MNNNTKKTPIIPIPEGVEAPPFAALGARMVRKQDEAGQQERPRFVAAWTYRLASGEEAFYIARFELTGRKLYLPVSWCADDDGFHAWSIKGPTGLRPLFDLDVLTDHPEAKVLVVEGEKTAAATEALAPPGWCVTTSPFGAKSAAKTDWTPLRGRVVVVWPDADPAGQAYAELVRAEALRAGAAEVRIVALPAGLPDGWDLADERPHWLTEADVQRLVLGEQAEAVPMNLLDPHKSEEPSDGMIPQLQGISDGTTDGLEASAASESILSPEPDALEGIDGVQNPVPEKTEVTSRPCFGPYISTDDGIWIDDPEAKVPGKVWLSAPIEVVALTRDTRGGKWGLLLRWRDGDGTLHQEVLPKDLLCVDWRETVRILVRGGLRISSKPKSMFALITYLAGATVKNRVRLVDRIGWKSGVYVLPDETIGREPGGETFVLAHPVLDNKFATSGTLSEWQDQIAIHAVGNSRLTFVICCGLASSLIPLMGSESGGFQLYGPSSRGKTTLVDVGGSVCGGPAYRETWKATGTGLEVVARGHNHALLVLDEQGMVLPGEAAEIAYLLASGLSKIRGTPTLELGERHRWSLLFLSTGEVTLADKVREGGKIPRVGQDVRLVDIPAVPDGCDQVLEQWRGFPNSGALAKHLGSASQKFYGTAARAFIRQVAQADPDLLSRVRQGIKNWVAREVPAGSDTQIERVADRFGLVGMAGELAIRFGVVPWERGTASWAAGKCFESWLQHRGNTAGGEDQQGIRALIDFIAMHGSSRFADLRDPQARINNRAGYLRMQDDGSSDYLLTPAGWKEVCAGQDATAIARACEAAGLLITAREGNVKRYAVNVKIAGATERLYVVPAAGLASWRSK